MKKTRLLQSLVVISIILSFFSCVYAASTQQFNIDDTNVIGIKENYNKTYTVITANANVKTAPTGTITFSPKSTGVFSVDVQGLTRYPEQDLYYILTDSKGNEVRLAAYYDKSRDKYLTFSNGNDRLKTKIDVILFAGEKYTINLSSEKAYPNTQNSSSHGYSVYDTYVNSYSNVQNSNYSDEDFKVILAVNTDSYNILGNIFQSEFSAREISDDTSTINNLLEPINSQYKLPDNVLAEFNNFDLGDLLTDLGENIAVGTTEYVLNPLEEIICDLLLVVGDHLVNMISSAVGEDVTITKLVYNQIDSLNPNFFDKNLSAGGITATLKNVVSDWYNVFRMIAVAIYIVILLAIGIHVLLASTGNGLAKAKDLFTQWLKGIVALVFIPYLIKYAFLLNEALVEMLREASDIPDYAIGSYFSSAGEWSAVELEYRSPDYMSIYTGTIPFGSEEANNMYISRAETYEQNLDLMRLMRAYAGATKKIIYLIIFFILIGQLISFIVIYFKRYIMIAFLIAMFPVVCIFHGISIAKGSAKGEMGAWVKEILTNIFIQFVHATVYTVVTGMCIAVVKEDIRSSATLNWIVIILAINFVSDGEKLLRKIIGAMGNSVGDSGQTSKGIKGAYGKTKANIKKLLSGDEEKNK